MPRKIKALIRDLKNAGWLQVSGGKGSHRKFAHPTLVIKVILSGHDNDDAKPYQEKEVKKQNRNQKQMGKRLSRSTVQQRLVNKYWYPWRQYGIYWYRKGNQIISSTGIPITKGQGYEQGLPDTIVDPIRKTIE
jgi:predicted RNA binding protein YcfA (HicA-like mRNA interferase family)